MDVEVPFLYEEKEREIHTSNIEYVDRDKSLHVIFSSELGKLDSDLAAAAASNNIALGTIAGVIFTIAQCHNENQEVNHCHGEFDPRKHLFFPVRYKKINEVISNIQH